jgi:hypothetical protein
MKIGWDLDGCLAEQNVINICLIKGNKELEEVYYSTVVPKCHPEEYASPKDEVYIITGRGEALRSVTESWMQKWFPKYKLYMTPVKQWATIDGWKVWYKAMAEAKAKQINDLQIDVYFEDMPAIVDELRKLCPNTRVIQFGGRSR